MMRRKKWNSMNVKLDGVDLTKYIHVTSGIRVEFTEKAI